MSETNRPWHMLTPAEQTLVIEIHATGYGANVERMRGAFETGKPNVIMGEANGVPFCKVAPDSVLKMQLLINPILIIK